MFQQVGRALADRLTAVETADAVVKIAPGGKAHIPWRAPAARASPHPARRLAPAVLSAAAGSCGARAGAQAKSCSHFSLALLRASAARATHVRTRPALTRTRESNTRRRFYYFASNILKISRGEAATVSPVVFFDEMQAGAFGSLLPTHATHCYPYNPSLCCRGRLRKRCLVVGLVAMQHTQRDLSGLHLSRQLGVHPTPSSNHHPLNTHSQLYH